jgi:GT2 family glycosyltransferase
MPETSERVWPRISVVVLTWNGREDTLKCLASLREVGYPNWEVLIVDNGSEDGTVDAIHQEHPWVTVIETGKNLGFALGNNIGIRAALQREAELILLLNNDTVVAHDLLYAFVKAASDHPDAGVLGAKIYYFSDPQRLWYAGGRWDADRGMFDHVGIGKIDDGVTFEQLQDTDYACGCAMMIRASAANAVGLLEERFFALYEEADWCYRARRAGFRCVFVPRAKVWHRISKTFGGRSIIYEYFDLRNRLLWAERNLSLPGRWIVWRRTMWLLWPGWGPGQAVRRLLRGRDGTRQASLEVPPQKRESLDAFHQPPHMVRKAQRRAVTDYLTRQFGNCPPSIRAAARKAKQVAGA